MALIYTQSAIFADVDTSRYIEFGLDKLPYMNENEPSNWFPYYTPMFDFFFDTTLILTDTFYISRTLTYNLDDTTRLYPLVSIFFEIHIHYDLGHLRVVPWEKRLYRDTLWTGTWHEEEIGWHVTGLFPIIRRDCDSCPQVRGVEVIPAGNGQAFLRWQRGTNHIDWQVSYGPAGTAPDDGTIIEFTNPISNIISFNPDSHYVAYVRARCRFARYEWGPWSDPVSIHLGDNGIDEAALASMVTLSPNPATDEVSIDSPVPMALVEAYDEKGACILRQELNTQHSSLNTKTWSSGAYVLRIHTQQGVATKRLTVMR
ncbi:MAG: T9SS type A sorting domain-containing protein [Bacteroidales bacterium]|nr:T9SS type A sorting domain-containing protein [Bacteroidales bacterium]